MIQGQRQSPPTHLFKAYWCLYVCFNSGASACIGHVCNEVMPECQVWKPRGESLGLRTPTYLFAVLLTLQNTFPSHVVIASRTWNKVVLAQSGQWFTPSHPALEWQSWDSKLFINIKSPASPISFQLEVWGEWDYGWGEFYSKKLKWELCSRLGSPPRGRRDEIEGH